MGNEVETKILEFLNAGFSDLKSDMASMREELKQVHEQTKKTNGRVTKLEEWQEQIELKQAEQTGAGAVKADAKARRWEVCKMVISATVGGIVAIIFGFFRGGK